MRPNTRPLHVHYRAKAKVGNGPKENPIQTDKNGSLLEAVLLKSVANLTVLREKHGSGKVGGERYQLDTNGKVSKVQVAAQHGGTGIPNNFFDRSQVFLFMSGKYTLFFSIPLIGRHAC